ncbi:MAG: hypothetical protein JWM34_2492 [Ilumatobacteraceae bacterium]|nr:hypothetical protein [Ilumatobacteraceae bacterium]
MLDHDISARDAFALLSTRPDPMAGLDRRRFLQLAGLGIGGAALLDTIGSTALGRFFPDGGHDAFAAAPLGADQGVLVLVGMYGGNDGLNTVVPYSNPKYAAYRSNIAIAQNRLLTLDGSVGLHPNLTFMKSMWDQQQLAVVQGVGYPDPNLSHFDSMATWMYGNATPTVGAPSSGWIGRWLDGLGSSADLLTTAVLGTDLPLHMVGLSRQAVTIPDYGLDYGAHTDDDSLRMYNGVRAYSASSGGRGPWFDAFAATARAQLDMTHTIAPAFTPDPPDGALLKKLTIAARLINADVGLRVIDASFDNFDTHSDEPTEHDQRMAELDAGLRGFFATLDPRFAGRVTVMTFSEFGRTPWSNGSLGTDHGTTNNHFVIGANVKGGLYGQQPALQKVVDGRTQDLEEWDRLDFNVDFRSLYDTVLDGLLGGGSGTVLGGAYPKLDLFRPDGSVAPGSGAGASGSGGSAAGVQSSTGSDFVGIVPDRLLDTRTAGGAPIGPASSIDLQVAGVRSVPGNAVAAVLNVTAVGATSASYLTVWPTGVDQPGTSSLNVAGGDVVPNLVIAKLGANGKVSIYNNAGTVDCVVDVVGYFQAASASRFTSLAPARVLDTRIGLGAPTAAVGQAASIDLQITGQGGVAGDADSVVLNVTVTEPTGEGYVTVWPTGAAMPTASNLNFVPGQTVPNLVVAKLGDGGKVSLFNSSGNTHLVADVLGSFSASGGARLTSLAPARLLDTRSDGSGPKPVGQTPMPLLVVGRGGVPASGVTAVVLNVTATAGTRDGYVTVYPTGQDAPMASNLNTVAGQTRANLVIAKVGGDGSVAMFNSAGDIHLVADVVGYFTQ